MYIVSEKYIAAAEANTRDILIKAIFNNDTELTGNNLIDMTVTEATNASGGLSMGATISSKLSMQLKMPDIPLVLDGGFVTPSVSFSDNSTTSVMANISDSTLIPTEDVSLDNAGVLIFSVDPEIDNIGTLLLAPGLGDCPLGKFYITQATSKDDFETIFDIVAYDSFCKTESEYEPTIAMPNTAEAILKDIAAQCNFSISSDIIYPSGMFDLYDWTCRKYIGYFAGLVGRNARFDRNGDLAFVWYKAVNCNVSRDLQYMGGFKRLTSSDFSVQSITSGSSDKVLVSGTGVGISFENPLMTQTVLDKIFSEIGQFSYTPANLKWRGNPAIEAGDIIMAEDKTGTYRTVYVMEQILRISGGMYSEIKCYGDSEAAINFSTSPQTKKLQQVYNKLQDAVKSATELLNGANGGVFEITDENNDGINDGWIIHSADKRQFIKANVNGIGITTDGGATYEQALTPLGLNASTVTTGQMNAQRISVGCASLDDVFSVDVDDDGHPIVTIGSSANDIKQKQTNDAINFVNGNDDTVAKFSVTGAEWEDAQEIKYCGFVWTKSTVTGNVRFTKVGEN